MTTYRQHNYARQAWPQDDEGSPLALQPGDAFERCNFAQEAPHTPICAAAAGLVFRDCNLTNGDVPADAVVERCTRAQVRTWWEPTQITLQDGTTIRVDVERWEVLA